LGEGQAEEEEEVDLAVVTALAEWGVDEAVAEGQIEEEETVDDDARKSVATGASKWKWITPEVHVSKGEAFQFVAAKVGQLLNLRDQLNDDIASTDAQMAVLSEDEVVPVPEDPPETYVPWRFNGPQLYAVVDEV
jgi:hypothetical protein